MRKILTLIFINIVLALLQTAFFPVLFNVKNVLNLVLVFGLSWLLVNAPITSLKSVFVGGIILDILLGTRLGLSSLIMTSGIYLLILIKNYLFRGQLSHFISGTLVSLAYYMIIYGLSFSVSLMLTAAFTSASSILLALLMKQLLLSRR